MLVGEPDVEDTIAILRGLKERYEVHHGVRITDAAIVAAATLSDRYIADRFLPDKAIDLIDEAASRLKMEIESVPVEIDEVDAPDHAARDRAQALIEGEGQGVRGAARGDRAELAELKRERCRLKAPLAGREGGDRRDQGAKAQLEEAQPRGRAQPSATGTSSAPPSSTTARSPSWRRSWSSGGRG